MSDKTCVFCGRPEREVDVLVGDPRGPLICNRCIETAHQAVAAHTVKVQETQKYEQPPPSCEELRAHLDAHVVGQLAAKEDLILAVYDHYLRKRLAQADPRLEVRLAKSNVLVLGPSGSGKTLLAQTLARLVGVPFFVGDANRLTQHGYVGDDVDSLLQGLLHDAGGEVDRAEWGIVVIDEIDKLACTSTYTSTGHRDIAGRSVQQALLTLIEGTKLTIATSAGKLFSALVQDTTTLDTTNILFIAAGSFDGIQQVVQRRLGQDRRAGFGASSGNELSLADSYRAVEQDDLLEYGMIPELVGRLPIVTATLPLTRQDIRRVLTDPKDSPLRQAHAMLAADGIDLQVDESALDAIAQEASAHPTGARAVRTILSRVLKPARLACFADRAIRSVLITEAAVRGTAGPLYVRRSERPSVGTSS